MVLSSDFCFHCLHPNTGLRHNEAQFVLSMIWPAFLQNLASSQRRTRLRWFKRIWAAGRLVLCLETPGPDVSFKQLFTTKTVVYSREEIKVAQRLSWSSVSPSLPDEVGLLPLEDFLPRGHASLHPELYGVLAPDRCGQGLSGPKCDGGAGCGG
jgi:hypothetical protein